MSRRNPNVSVAQTTQILDFLCAFAPLRETLLVRRAVNQRGVFERRPRRELGPLPRPERRRAKRRRLDPQRLGAGQLSLEAAAAGHRPQLAGDLGRQAVSHLGRSATGEQIVSAFDVQTGAPLWEKKFDVPLLPHQRPQQLRLEHAGRRCRAPLRHVAPGWRGHARRARRTMATKSGGATSARSRNGTASARRRSSSTTWSASPTTAAPKARSRPSIATAATCVGNFRASPAPRRSPRPACWIRPPSRSCCSPRARRPG